MNVLIEHLKKETIQSISWTNILIETFPDDKWFVSPDVIDSSIAWQIGHLTLSQYYYTIFLLKGPSKDLTEKINTKMYWDLFAKGGKSNELFSAVTVEELKNNWDLICSSAIFTLDSLQDTDLNDGVFKLKKPHPFVKTMCDSISWNIKHNMWHCGQIATLKRVVDKPLDFGMS